MKKLIALIIGLAFAVGVTTGCKTPVQRTAYNTIASVEQAATVAIDSYYALVVRGVVATNEVPQVSAIYNKIQTDGQIAAAAAQNGVSATATPDMLLNLGSLTSLITTLQPSK